MPQQILKIRFGGRALHHPRSSGSKARPVVPYYRVPTNGLLWVSVTALRLARRILPHGGSESICGSRCARRRRMLEFGLHRAEPLMTRKETEFRYLLLWDSNE